MADVLRPLGYAMADTPEQADLVVLNTCHIRENASEKVYSELGRLRDTKRERRAEGRDLTIAVAGCVAQAEGEEIVRRQPAVDIVVGPQAYHRLPELLAEAERKTAHRRAGKRLPGAGVLDTDFPAESKFDHLPAPQGVRAGSAFLSIQEGCDKFCTFCVVPYTRGAEYSRPASAVLSEARQLVAAGAIEITLLGQNVNAYHGEAPAWRVDLVAGAADPCAGRDRWRGAHPLHDLPSARHGRRPDRGPRRGAAAHALPAPAGAVGLRPHPRGDEPPPWPRSLLRLVDRLRHARADLALSSDFIVGFPGESDADFDDTMRLVDEVGFAPAFSFKYSRRPGTPGSAMPDQVPERGEGRAARRPAGAARPAGARLQHLQGRRHRARCCSPRPAASPARSSARRRGCSRSMPTATRG